jgi:DNA-binding transcriptional LysR family regulator
MLDWDDLRFLLAVARHGTLSAAARTLKVTQPTVGRRIARFEERLGARLLERTGPRWTITSVGRTVLAHAESMQEHALAAESLASGRDRGIAGQVTITASEWVARSVLGPALGPLLTRHPALSIDLVADARHLSLVKREADIALRPSPFTHQEVTARELARIEFGLYASEAYLARHGLPNFARGCEGHVLIGMSEGLARSLADYAWLPLVAARARVAIRSNGRAPMASMAAAGLGMAVLPRVIGDAEPGLRLLDAPGSAPVRKLWIGVHRTTRATPRIRATLAHIVQSFEQRRLALCPSIK